MRVGGPTHPKREDVKFHVLPPCGVELSDELDVLRKFLLQFLSILRVRAEADLNNVDSDYRVIEPSLKDASEASAAARGCCLQSRSAPEAWASARNTACRTRLSPAKACATLDSGGLAGAVRRHKEVEVEHEGLRPQVHLHRLALAAQPRAPAQRSRHTGRQPQAGT